jgi:hypothetical protein
MMAMYRAGMSAVGFTNVTLTPTHEVADGMSSMIVRAEKHDG